MTSPSYLHGNAGAPLRGLTIGQFLDEAAAEHGDRDAVVSVAQGIRWTYAELKQKADTLAAAFHELGLRPGDRVGIWSPNRAEWVVMQFAAARIGLILVTINPAYKLSELEYVLKVSGCRALVLASRFKSSDYVAMVASLASELHPGAQPFTSERVPELRRVVVLDDAAGDGYLHFSDVMAMGAHAGGDGRATAHAVQFDDAVSIQFTSGTTGLPKGVTLSHHNLLNNGVQVAEATGIRAGDRVCLPVPLFHCFGMVMGVLACVARGACMVFPGEGFDAGDVLRAVEAERCTHLYGVPTMFIAMLGHEHFRDFDLRSLRGGIMAGAPCPAEVMKAVMADMHMTEVTIAYGMTETSPVSFQTRRDDPVDARVTTVGRVLPHIEAKVVAADGRIVPRGESGELCTRGYAVMIGYWDDEGATRAALDTAGWMRTGDLATIDADGYCRIVGRIKDIVIRGGENISPREVEELLYRHPSVREVQVVGVPDTKYGEELCAWIVLRADRSASAEELRAFCGERIAHYKVPRYLRFVDGFPTTTSGKVKKYVMRQMMMEELASTSNASPQSA